MRHWWKKVRDSSFATLLSEARGVPVLRVSGDIVLGVAPSFEAALEKALDAVERAEDPARVLIVDVSNVEFMDTVGLGTLLGSAEILRKRGGEVKLAGPSKPVMRLLEITGIMDLFRVYPDVLSAAAKPSGAAPEDEGPGYPDVPDDGLRP